MVRLFTILIVTLCSFSIQAAEVACVGVLEIGSKSKEISDANPLVIDIDKKYSLEERASGTHFGNAFILAKIDRYIVTVKRSVNRTREIVLEYFAPEKIDRTWATGIDLVSFGINSHERGQAARGFVFACYSLDLWQKKNKETCESDKYVKYCEELAKNPLNFPPVVSQ